MVLADKVYRGGLVALDPFLLGDHQRHLAPHLDLVEAAANDGMAVEIDLVAVPRADEAMVLVGKEPHHLAVQGWRVSLHVAAPQAHLVLQAARGGSESVA